MALLLRFNVADLKPLIEHAHNSKKFKEVMGFEGVSEPGLMLVKDNGAYLMSNGNPGQPRSDGKPGCETVYALHRSPEDGFICGDDFVELFTLNELKDFLALDGIEFIIKEDSIEIQGYTFVSRKITR